MRVLFMGTPEFAVPTLEALIQEHEVIGVYTQPDKPKGRGKAMAYPPVKEKALEHNLPVYQPVKVREASVVAEIEAMNPDAIVVVAFGQILPESILNIPKYGCINVHASLLPKYRGAAPIQWAVINGDPVTGVTIQQMDIGVDTGDIVAIREVPISEEETGGGLFDKLAVVGAELCVEAMESIENDRIIDKILCMCPVDDIDHIEKLLQAEFPNLSIVKSADIHIEVNQSGVNKGTAVELLCRHKNIPIDTTIGFGDNFNDYVMLKTVGRGFVMENAPENMKKDFSNITDTNDNDGLYQALKALHIVE